MAMSPSPIPMGSFVKWILSLTIKMEFQEKRYHAEKDKGFSYLASYKTIATDILLTDRKLELTRQLTWFVFFKRPATHEVTVCDTQTMSMI